MTPRPNDTTGEQGTALVTDHVFRPKGERMGDWWTLCAECNLSEASHSATAIEHPMPRTYRCADCIAQDRECPMLDDGRLARCPSRSPLVDTHVLAEMTEKTPASTLKPIFGEGKICSCGGLMQRTGACNTCSSCGNTDGGCG